MRRIAIARVKHVSICRAHLLLIVSNFESRSLVDRRGKRAIFLIKIGAAANRFGFWTVLMLFHKRLQLAIATIKTIVHREVAQESGWTAIRTNFNLPL